MDDNIFCPLIDNEIPCVDCMENRDIKEEFIPAKFKLKNNWKDICNNCKYHEE